ncbi:MAG TPA: Stk1 family PASTA domain-containing Ser/Thr kinase [Actinomycetota bacterium]|jgi:serine/threonine-protein kinase|nr:Stk1 family PASTA domain-containing Ser/Thr kinase [Actinomycetota bacterium]
MTIDQPVMLGGRYRVENELGRGGMAKVYRGQDTVLGRTVAIKILAPQYAEDQGFVQRFRREAQAAARISNQTIVSVFDTGSDDGVHFIVMEYVEGRTLADYLTGGGRIMPDRAIDIAIDVARALEAAHAQGVIHRDIKPGNIMLDGQGDVKVTDFGIARVTATAETVAQTAAVLGTASYLSPEQAQGQPVDIRSDIYSLGCVLFEMVTGRPPFPGDSPVAVASKHVLEQPTPPSQINRDVSPDLDAVILRALAKNPANRYQSATEMREDLERVKRGQPVEATPLLPAGVGTTQVIHRDQPAQTAVLPPTGPPEQEERSRWWIPVLVTLLILGLLGIVLFFLAQNLLEDEQPQAQMVSVPDVVGDPRREAEQEIRDAGLEVGEIVPAPAEDHPDEEPGTVIEQNPAADQQVSEGTEVILTVVAQPELVAVPDIPEGSSFEEAQSILADAGLVAVPQDQASDTVEEGDVIGTEPPAGTDVEPESEVQVLISTGPGTVAVPEVRCQSFPSAQNELSNAGLNPVISDERVEINPACPLGNKVAAQEPSAGTEAEQGETVTLFAGEESVPTGPTGATGATGD